MEASGGDLQLPDRRFRDDRRGTTAVLFGLSVIPVMAIVGSAVDYGRASAARTELQRAVDAAALTLVRDAASLDEPKLKERGRSLVRGLLKELRGFSADTITVSRNAKTIRVAASGTMKTAFMAVAGFDAHRDRLRGGIDLGLDPHRARPRPRQHRLDERGARRQAQDRRPQDRRPRPPRHPARRRPRRRHREGLDRSLRHRGPARDALQHRRVAALVEPRRPPRLDRLRHRPRPAERRQRRPRRRPATPRPSIRRCGNRSGRRWATSPRSGR